jgi:hypothetical protein
MCPCCRVTRLQYGCAFVTLSQVRWPTRPGKRSVFYQQQREDQLSRVREKLGETAAEASHSPFKYPEAARRGNRPGVPLRGPPMRSRPELDDPRSAAHAISPDHRPRRVGRAVAPMDQKRLSERPTMITHGGWPCRYVHKGALAQHTTFMHERASKLGPPGIGRIMCAGCCWRGADDNAAPTGLEGGNWIAGVFGRGLGPLRGELDRGR